MFNVFITESILRRISLSEGNARSYLFKIMKGKKRLFASLDSSNGEELLCLSRKHGLKVETKQSDYIKSLSAHPKLVLQNPSSLFILDIPVIEAEKIQKSFGVVCISGEKPDVSLLIDTNDEHTTNQQEPLGNGWDTVLNSLKAMPSNALLLCDRYLFSFASSRMGDGFANVQNILEALLPQRFLDEYHVTIAFDQTNIHPSLSFNGIATRLNKIKQELHRDYPVSMEVLGITPDCAIYNKLHNRRIISNYYIVKCEHKLAAFNQDKGTSQQTITPQVLFTEDSLNRHSTPPLKSINQMTTALREFSLSLPNFHSHSIYCYALNGRRIEKCTGIRNRLIE